MSLTAPFPWFGGKRRVADLVWGRFGDVPNYVEPFAGSLAVLLGRPTPPRTETVNDKDAYVANFWRALQAAPEQVAHHADWPVNEADLHARHRWLVAQGEFRERMLADPDFYDVKIAGWWVWGLCMWIGSGWCSRPEWTGRGTAAGPFARGINTRNLPAQLRELGGKRGVLSDGAAVAAQIPYLRSDGQGLHKRPQLPGGAGHGVHRDLDGETWQQRPDLGNGGEGRGIHRKLPYADSGGRGGHRARLSEQMPDLAGDSGATGRGVHASAKSGIYEWFDLLAARLRRVRICCGEWDRILGPSPTWRIGTTAVLLDPPYAVEDREDVYSHESRELAHKVREWAIANGDNPLLRIALCGYEGEHEMPDTWTVVAWKAHGGYGGQRKDGGNTNAHRERIWFSPHCLPADRPLTLWDALDSEAVA